MPDITFKEFEMPDVGTPSLDQLRVFLTVVEAGSFAAAGRRLSRATSAVSYTIANLERQLGIALFDRERTRKPALTDAGAALLSKARAVSGGIDDLRASGKGIARGPGGRGNTGRRRDVANVRLDGCRAGIRSEISDRHVAPARRGPRRRCPARARRHRRHRCGRDAAHDDAWVLNIFTSARSK